MEKILFKWLTVSSWINETILFFQEVDIKKDLKTIREEVKEGKYFNGKQDSTVQRIFSEIVQKYLKNNDIKEIVYNISNSKLPIQEKAKYLLVPFLNDETLRAYFIEEYIFEKYEDGRKIFTQNDLDIFFNHIFQEKKDRLPNSILETIEKQGVLGDSSMKKARNQIFKFLEDFNFANKTNGQIIVRRPSFSNEWFLYALAFHYPNQKISIEQLYEKNIFKKYLINTTELRKFIEAAALTNEIKITGDEIEINNEKEIKFIKIA